MSTPLLAHEVEISQGLTLADLKTVDDCHMALLTIARDINRIEEQLADGPVTGEWAERAESAVRFKKALRQTINERIGSLRRAARSLEANTREHMLVELFKSDWPAEFAATWAKARSLRPELWKD